MDIRLVAATNENLEAAIARGTFRADLYHRINEFTLRMPELRQMSGDIPLFADFFLDQANRELGKRIVGFDAAALAALTRYDWPGNLRQLKNTVKSATLLAAAGGNKSQAAKLLGVDRKTLYNKLHHYGIE